MGCNILHLLTLGLLTEGANICLEKSPRYLQKHPKSVINISSCTSIDFKDSDEEEECYSGRLNDTVLSGEIEQMSIPPCCPSHGFIETGTCGGTDKDGGPATFSNVDLCLHHSEARIVTRRHRLECPSRCSLVQGYAKEHNPKFEKGSNNKVKVTHKGKQYDHNVCLGIRCDNKGERFDFWFEACGQCNTEAINDEISKRFNASLCCGLEGKLSKTSSCSVGVMEETVLREIKSTCNWRNKRSMVLETPVPVSRMRCVSATETGEGALVCHHHCQGEEDCLQLCKKPQMGTNWRTNTESDLPINHNLTQVLGIGSMLVSGIKKQFNQINKTVYLYPEWQCEDRVRFLANGSLVLVVDSSRMLHYGEFCVEPLAGDLSRGRYRLVTHWQEEQVDRTGRKNAFYNVVLCISVACLMATIAIYGIFWHALLCSEYNKTMLHFACCLLLAFLSLLAMRSLSEQMTPVACGVVTVVNQFTFIAAFSLLTLMSYSISYQIYSMTSIDSSQQQFRRRISLAYTIPAFISILTIIVELVAPRCALARPKFGLK